ncbi:hypothetical protein DESPIGER_1909 [Desulfovibrio piger]|uniref:Uncharacterized protein n=1 Tax=Desulfovibrio piger TaxID=901 RepID=A0A1K1LGB3_9BACT|nr:hypothetical protein DESPIGER_1909 [Desulfovibrio piger]
MHWSVLHGSVWPAAVLGPQVACTARGGGRHEGAGPRQQRRPLPKKHAGLSASP